LQPATVEILLTSDSFFSAIMSKKANTVEDRDFKVVRITIDEQSGGKPKADSKL